jgi:DNA modification methylase
MRNTIHNCDSRDVLVKIPVESVDGVFTDPPFNIDLTPQRGTHEKIANDALSPEEFSTLIDTVFGELYRVLRNNTCAWICCNWQCDGIFKVALEKAGFEIKNCIVWVKNNWGLGNHFRPQHEFILAAFKGSPNTPQAAQSNVWYYDRPIHTLHPNEKPTDMIRNALMYYNKPGDLIVDPFAGSFSTVVAAKELGMDYIACEKMACHFATGKQRVEGGVITVVNAKGTLVQRKEGTPLADLLDE